MSEAGRAEETGAGEPRLRPDSPPFAGRRIVGTVGNESPPCSVLQGNTGVALPMPDRHAALHHRSGTRSTRLASRLRILVLVGCACTLGPVSCLSGKEVRPPPVEDDLLQRADRTAGRVSEALETTRATTRMKSAEALEAIEESNRQRAIEKYRSLLERKDDLDATIRQTSLFNLGHLLFEQCLADFRKSMREFERAYAAFREGEIPEEPTLPRYDFTPAREIYEAYLAAYPASPRRPEITYHLAFSYEEQGELDRAMTLYNELVQTAPASRFAPEASMRLGEHYFEMDRFDTALDFYAKLQDTGDTQFYEKALFKTGWALYAKNDYAQAEEAFARLLHRQASRPAEARRDLYDEALEILAKIQSETGGPKALDSFLQRHDNPVYGLDLSLHLGRYFQETSRYEDAIGTYRSLLQRYPHCAQAPFVEQSLIESLKTEKRTAEAEALQASLLDRYGRGTPWDLENPDPQLRKRVDTFLWDTLNHEILAHHRRARESSDPEAYEKTLDLYRQSIDYFPLDESLYETRYRYAEALFESGKLNEAAREYERVSKLEPFEKHRESAGSKRIQCLEQLRAKEKIPLDEMLAAYEDYVVMNPGSEKAPLLLFKQGEILFNASRHDEAAAFFRRVRHEYPDHPDTLRARVLELEALFHAARYAELETHAADFLASSFSLTAAQRARTEHLLRFAQFEQARSAQEAERYAEAAFLYEKLVREAPGIDIAPDALFNAAVSYKALGDWPRAVACFEEITTRYPRSKHYTDSLLAPLPYYEQTEQWSRMLTVMDKLYALDPRHELARESLFGLARRLYRRGDSDAARTAFSRYTARYPEDVARRLEILYLEAELDAKQASGPEALQGYQRFLDAYAQARKTDPAVDVDPAAVAKARFMVLEPVFDQYESIRLVTPLQRNLARKQSLSDRLVSNYLEMAKSGAGPYTVAAAFRVGLVYERFWESLLQSEIPKGMTEEEVGIYRDLLAQQAEPYREKATDAYRVTLERTRGRGVLTPWMFRTYSRLADLEPVGHPPLTQDTVLWRESFDEQRTLFRNLDGSNPRGFSDRRAAALERELESALTDLQHGLQGPLDPQRDRDRIRRTVVGLEALLEKEPGLYEVHYNLGILHQMIGEPDRARTEYLLALQENPELPVAQFNLGILYLQGNELANAAETFRELTRLAPEYAGSWYLLGVTLSRQRAFRDAEAPLKRAISVLPEFLDPHIELGRVYMQIGEPEEAFRRFERVRSDPSINARLLRKLGWNFLENGDLEQAVDCYLRIEAMQMAVYEDWNNLGVAYLRGARLEPSLAALDQARQHEPDRPEAINNLGLVYLKKNDYDKAAVLFEQASMLAEAYLAPVLNAAVLYGEFMEDSDRAAAAIDRYLALGGNVQREMLSGWIVRPFRSGATDG